MLLAWNHEDATLIDLQREYDNRLKVPDYPDYLDRWMRDAATFRDSHPTAELDVSYGPSEQQVLDIFWPDAARDAPLAMFVHGGYWQSLDKNPFSHLARGLVSHGIAVALPSYDLCPNVTLAVVVEQVRDAAAFLARRHARGLLAMGHSAGGHLSAMLMATDWPARSLPAATVPAAFAISGLFDLVPLLATKVNDALRLDQAEALRLSPVKLPRPRGRIHAIVGDEEGLEYARQTRIIAEAWGGSWESVPGANHFSIVDPLADPASRLVGTVRRLIA